MLTASEILEEYGKCLLDPKYGIETFFETLDQTQGGFVKFKLFTKQRDLVDAYEKHRFNLVSKPRQAGITTTTAAYLSIKIACADSNNPEAILILANKQDMAFEFLGKVKEFLLQIPRYFWGTDYYGTPEKEAISIFSTESKKELKLPNGSRVRAVATSKDALRGYTPTYLIMDEAAYIDNGAIVFGAAFTALSTGGRATLISTPNGQDALYYDTYEQAKTKDNDFNIIEMRWYYDDRYNKDLKWVKGGETKDEIIEVDFTFESYDDKLNKGYKPTSSWYEDMCRGMNNNAQMIAQELDVSFIGSGGNVIDEKYIEFHEKNNVLEPKFISGNNHEFWIWDKPKEGHQYILGCDVSRGDSKDYSVISIVDFTTMEQVMEYRGKMQPDLLGEFVNEYGLLYDAYVIVDITGGMGVSTILKLEELGYPNLHFDSQSNKILENKRRKRLAGGQKDLDNQTAGFNVGANRLPMVANFEYMIRTNAIKIRSRRIISEMKTFVYKNGRPDHQDGKHDDTIMAMAMSLWVLEHSFKNLKKLKNKTKTMLSSWVLSSPENSTTIESSGFTPKANKNKASLNKPNFSPQVARNMQDPKGEFLWLFSGMK